MQPQKLDLCSKHGIDQEDNETDCSGLLAKKETYQTNRIRDQPSIQLTGKCGSPSMHKGGGLGEASCPWGEDYFMTDVV